jgi:hypothetical protein
MIYLASAKQDGKFNLHYFYYNGNIYIKSRRGVFYNTVRNVLAYSELMEYNTDKIEFIVPCKYIIIENRAQLTNIIDKIIFEKL